MVSRHHKFFFSLLLVSIVGGMGFLYYQSTGSAAHKTLRKSLPYISSGPSLQITGVRYDGNREGTKSISIRADKFTIERKRLGFFRLSLFNVAKLKNAIIDVYGERIKPSENAVMLSKVPSSGKSQSNPQSPRLSFKSLFTAEALPSSSVKRISSLLIEPVCLNLHDEKSLVTQIIASSANIRLRNRDVLFEGDVRVKSRTATLKTGRLILLPENGLLRAEGHFILETPEKRLEGEQFTTNIFLKN